MNILDQTKMKMVAALEHLKHELKGIRTGRANPAILDSLLVEVYGSPTRIKEVASITTPEPRQLLITPFDPQTTGAIGKSIEKANLGLPIVVEANLVRIKIPPMDENLRKEMVKLCYKKCEEAKVSLRNVRREGNDAARKLKNDGEMAEDILKKTEKSIQELTDKFCKEADDIASKKEKEITTI